MRRRVVLPVAAASLAAAVAGWSVLADRPAVADPAPAVVAPVVSPLNAPAGGINLRRTVTVAVVEQTKDAVVNISAKTLVTERVPTNAFWQPFDAGQVVQVPANSLGTGFLVHRDGYVVTNNHVIERAREISVELADGHTYPARVVGADPDADLAVLHIDAGRPLPVLTLGASSDLMIGEPVIAVGNPLGLSHSVSTGIVSALHRDINPAEGGRPGGEVLRDVIQTDAAINKGNSGGPLLNAYGQVIGINSAIRGDAQNIGFAIPIDRLRDLIPELMNPSQVTKVDVSLHLAERRTTGEPDTVATRLVTVGEHSQEVTALDGRRPGNIVDAYAQLLGLRAGQPLTVSFADGRTQRLTTTATPLPDAVVQARQRLGLSIVAVTPMLADRYKLPIEDGLLVTGVDRNSPAARADVQPGDILVRIGGVPLNTLDDFAALAARLPPHAQAWFLFLRGNEAVTPLVRF